MFGIFKKEKKLTLDDPVFGRIDFQRLHGIEMWCHSPNDESSHMILIVAPASGPTQVQREFYNSLRRDMISIEAECKRFISSQEEPPQNLQDMTIYSIEIGEEAELAKGKFVIELADKDADEIHCVEFMNRKPMTYGMDD